MDSGAPASDGSLWSAEVDCANVWKAMKHPRREGSPPSKDICERLAGQLDIYAWELTEDVAEVADAR